MIGAKTAGKGVDAVSDVVIVAVVGAIGSALNIYKDSKKNII